MNKKTIAEQFANIYPLSNEGALVDVEGELYLVRCGTWKAVRCPFSANRPPCGDWCAMWHEGAYASISCLCRENWGAVSVSRDLRTNTPNCEAKMKEQDEGKSHE